MSVQLRITLSEVKAHGLGELPVHEYVRVTTNVSGEGIKNLLGAAIGWMQQYGDQASYDQWQMDLARVERSQVEAVAAHEQARKLADELAP